MHATFAISQILTAYEGLLTLFYSSMYVKRLTDYILHRQCSNESIIKPSTILAHTRQLPRVRVIAVGATLLVY